jgi:hypothetical protein
MKKKRSAMKRCCKAFQLGIKKATSYNAVKGRLGWRFYDDKMLQSKINMTRKEFEELTS